MDISKLLRRGHASLTGQPASAAQPEINDVIAKVQASKGAIVFLPSIPWCASLFQRPHHLARFFAREGYVAIYDCDCAGPVQDDVRGFREIEPNLFLFRGPQRLLTKLPQATLWSFPYNFEQTDRYPTSFETVYDWIDALEIFYHRGREFVDRNHERALGEATVVATVTRTLHAQAMRTRSDALYLPNAVDFGHFAADVEVPDDPMIRHLREQGKPVAGYYGALASWFDYDLLTAVAQKRPDWEFLLIGPQYDPNQDRKPPVGSPNITWIGPRDYQALPGYLKLFDVAMIPFQVNEITKATSPLKLYEFFAGGKPVISSPMPECQAYSEVHSIATVEQFSSALDAALKESRDAAYGEHLRGLGRANSWAARVQTVVQAVDQCRTGQGSRLARSKLVAASSSRRPGRILDTGTFSAALRRAKRVAARIFPADTPHGRGIRSAVQRARRARHSFVNRPRGPSIASILRQNPDRKGIIIQPPFIDWTWMRQRPHQLMDQFAKAGYLSLFCSPRDRTDSFRGTVQVAERLYLCDNYEALSDVPDPILLIGWTGYLDTIQRFHRPTVIYDYLDNLGVSAEGGVPNRHKLEQHHKLITTADIVLATARQLYDEVRRFRADALYCPNGVDYEHFHPAEAPPAPADIADLVASGRPIIGYYGALARWFDCDLLAHAASVRTDCEFLLIGPDFDGTLAASKLTRLPNVHWVGEKKYQELPAYLHYFTVATIPFLINDITNATSPVKLFEYMAGTKPIVTTNLPECRQYACVLAARDQAEYVTMLDEAIGRSRSETCRQLLDTEARNNTWEARVRQIIARLDVLSTQRQLRSA